MPVKYTYSRTYILSEVTRHVPERTGAEIVRAMLKSGGALRPKRKHPHPDGYSKGIVKHRESGIYEALTSSLDPSLMTAEDLATRTNVLELNIAELQHQVLLLRGKVPPISISSVISYESGLLRRRQAKKVSPVSVPGNEAENLDDVPPLASVQVLAVPSSPLKSGDYTPHAVGVHPKETVKKLALISDASPNDVADIAWEYDMDLVELTEIAFDEYSRREMDCYTKYGMSRKDKRVERYLTYFGSEPRVGKKGPHVFHKSVDSAFGLFVYRTNMYEGSLKLRSIESLPQPHTYTHPLKLVPGEATVRNRLRTKLKDEIRTSIYTLRGSEERRAQFHEITKVSKRLSVKPGVTTSSQFKWLRSLLTDNTQWMKSKVAKLRDLYETEALTRSAPHATLGYWTNRWWEVSKFTPAEDIKPKWVRTWKTVCTTPMASPYYRGRYDDLPLDVLRAAERMEIISNSLIERGLYNPNEVLVMQAELQRGFGVNLDKLPNAPKNHRVLVNLRRSQQLPTIDSVVALSS